MNIKIKLDSNFSDKFDELKDKYGEQIASLNGLSNSQLDYTDFIDNFIDEKTVADATIDSNANVGQKSVVTLINEMAKPHQKLLAFNKIYYELKKKYGKEIADDWMEGEWIGNSYMHDFHTATFLNYCFAYDLKDLAEKGLFFIDNFNAEPPKHLGTFIDFVKEYVSFAANSTSGAVGMPNLIPYMYYFWKKDIKEDYYTQTPEKYAKQQIQRLIYALNQPFLRGNIQSAFTNTSIFDHPYLVALFGGSEFPDGSLMIDDIEGIMDFQKLFLITMSEIRNKNVMTFPVNTISLLKKDGKFIDEEFARWASKHNMKWADSNFFVDNDVSSLSNCPLSGETLITYKDKVDEEYKFDKIKNLYDKKEVYVIGEGGKLVKCKINKFNETPNYRITLANNITLTTTANHLNYVLHKKYVPTKELTTEDYLPFDRFGIDHCDYNSWDGNLLGIFLRCGKVEEDGRISFMFPSGNRGFTMYELIEDCMIADGENIRKYTPNEKVITNSSILKNIILNFTYKKNDKYYPSENILATPIDFRVGFISELGDFSLKRDGLSFSDDREFIETMHFICENTYNYVTDIMQTDYDESKYWFDIHNFIFNREAIKKDIVPRESYIWVRIKDIRVIDTIETESYCMEVLDEDVEPIFMLANGIMTHNCRLKSDIKDLYFNSIGGTALKVGSNKVNTINLANIAYQSETVEDYYNLLRNRTVLCLKVLDVVRHIHERNVEKGLAKNFIKGLIDFEHLYSTVGIIGLYEAAEHYGMVNVDKFNNHTYTEEGMKFSEKCMDIIHEEINKFREENGITYKFNIEAVPGESAAAKLMKKDKIMFPNEKYTLPLYGNQWIPLGVKCSINDKVTISAALDKACTGGSIAHVNIDSPFTDEETAWDMLNYITDLGVTYFAFCTRISSCKHNHGFYGETCPICGNPKETTYQRIVGFITPVKTYSKERKEEFSLREWFKVAK